MTGGYRVEADTLNTVSAKFHSAADKLGATEQPPEDVKAGEPSAAIAMVIAHLAEQSSQLVAGLHSIGDAVEQSRTDYEAQEQWSTDHLPKPEQGDNRPV
ncbi:MULTISPECIES: hypothetical protein [Prauserella salsuginis group]|uniref:Excreted virulence factor EspC (Type VII ESX diderm) n=2 Tax=Prauserella salsuginis group TaxID=2893672 RepID=A0A839XSV2_9PSEU|nr:MULTISPECIES: hypothetical protein [Prauserella salsuginis group]MBB3664058.1 hypothetical protein [Prauserella sediminis]MCR3721513.1 hypothetical protein [Prauserella flava]MCR3734205.1 hypothetical protein [Prauserella salsuginis]